MTTRAIFYNILSLELILACLIFVGNFKNLAIVKLLPIDATLFLSALLFLISIYILIFKSNSIKFTYNHFLALLFLSSFIIYYSISSLWSLSPSAAESKTTIFLIRLAMPSLVTALIIVQSIDRVNRLLNIIWWLSGIILLGSIYTFFFKINLTEGFINTFGSHYQIVGSAISFFLIISFYFLLSTKVPIVRRIFYLFSSLVSIYMMANIGNRAACISALFVCIILLFIKLIKDKYYFLVFLFFLLGIIFLIIFFDMGLIAPKLLEKMPTTINRIGVLFGFYGNNTSADLRGYYYQLTLLNIWPYILYGCGIGGWSVLVGLPNVAYPHNIFLEILSEGGGVALLLLICYLIICLKIFFRGLIENFNFDNPMLLIAGLFLSGLMQSMVSGSIATNFITFIPAALLLINIERKA